MRENIKSVGLILAIAIASVSLPIGIMGFNKDATINHYYTNNYYTTNNNTTIIDNSTTIINNNNTYAPEPEPEPELIIYPLIKNNYVFCNNAINHEENTEYIFHNYTYEATNNFRLDIFAFENYSIGNAYCYIYDLEFYDMFKILHGTLDIGHNNSHYDWRFPYASTWLFIFEMNANPSHSDPHINMTIYHQVREVYV